MAYFEVFPGAARRSSRPPLEEGPDPARTSMDNFPGTPPSSPPDPVEGRQNIGGDEGNRTLDLLSAIQVLIENSEGVPPGAYDASAAICLPEQYRRHSRTSCIRRDRNSHHADGDQTSLRSVNASSSRQTVG